MTVPAITSTRDVQNALRRIGWPIVADGAYGPRTHQAVLDFQRGWDPWDLLVDGAAGPQTREALRASLAYGGACGAGFRFVEFASKGDRWIKVHRALVAGLVVYRQRYGAPVRIVSGYRDPLHNAAEGGAHNSQHLYGNAADVEPRASLAAVRNLRLFSGIGVNRRSGRVSHVDVRHVGPNTTGGTPTSPTVWYYNR